MGDKSRGSGKPQTKMPQGAARPEQKTAAKPGGRK